MQEIQKIVFGICSLTIAINKDEKTPHIHPRYWLSA